jgi:lipoprotein NlpD
MQKNKHRYSRSMLLSGLCALLAACGSVTQRAPVEDRQAVRIAKPVPVIPATMAPTTMAPPKAAVVATVDKPLPGAENAGKPGYYMVKPGDTLIRIALDNGQNWRDLVKWNALDNPNLIEVGQVLRVAQSAAEAVVTKVVPAAKVESRPLDSKVADAKPADSKPDSKPVAAAPSRSEDDDIKWGWPASGGVTANFDEVRNKGLAFKGSAGDAVLAAADGRVMYAGSGLRGYGNMIIIKHSTNYLTAYAHNQALLVKEDEAVRKGQKIAEMGSSDSDQVKLHFEIRKQGKPVDPAKLLPAR